MHHLYFAFVSFGADMDKWQRVREWLSDQDQSWLVDQLYELIEYRPYLLTRYELLADISKALTSLDAVIDKATVMDENWLEKPGAQHLIGNVELVVDTVEKRLDTTPDLVITSCIRFINRIEAESGYVDDHDGELILLRIRLADIHRRACLLAKPDVLELAAELFGYMIAGKEGFEQAYEGYADVLGPEGRAEFRRLTQQAWDKMPLSDKQGGYDWRRDRLQTLLVRYARETGDFELQIKLLLVDGSYLQIVELCRSSSRFEDALKWAMVGVKAQGTSGMLGLMYAEELRRADRSEVAVEVMWQRFESGPSMAGFNELKEYAKDYDYWRDKAVGHIRKAIVGLNKWRALPLRSMLVDIFMAESNTEMALVEVESGMCSWECRTRLAEVCSSLEVTILYRDIITEIIDATTGSANPSGRYYEAVELMLKMYTVYQELGRESDFLTWLDTIKTEYSRKRNLMSLIRKHWL